MSTPAVPTQAEFDALYKSLQPTAVKDLLEMPLATMADLGAKSQKATQLAGEGYVIDGAIMVDGGSPFLITQYRMEFGYTWVPSWLQQPIQLAPGLTQGSTPPYDRAIMPAGAIPVTYAITPQMFPTPKV
jgi:hypothetical protein